MSLDIVIVNWNSGDHLRECVASIERSAAHLPPGHRLECVVVVDNGSTDGSQHFDVPAHMVLKRISNADNRGFAAACNQGAAACTSALVLFLNPDTLLFDNSLSLAVNALTVPGNERVGIVGIGLQDDSGAVVSTCSRFPRGHHYLAHALGITRVWPQYGQLMVEWDHRDTRTVDQVIGAFFLTRRKMFAALGGFDERFFVYLEEVDLSLRAHEAGWRSLYVADAQAYHKGGGSSEAVRARRLHYSLRSRLRYAAKHYGVGERALVQLVTWGLEPITRAIFMTAKRKSSQLTELLKTYQWLLAETHVVKYISSCKPALFMRDRKPP